MTDRTLRRSFIALHVSIVLVALVQSGQVLHHAIGALAEHHLLVLFAGLQLLGGILFLLPRTLRAGGAVLVVVFAHAAIYQAVNGQFPATALVCAVAALFVTLHGDGWRTGPAQRDAVSG